MAEIYSLPNNGHAVSNEDIARHLREIADWMEEEDAVQIHNVVLLIEYADGYLQRNTIGSGCDLARVAGLLSIAATRAAIGE